MTDNERAEWLRATIRLAMFRRLWSYNDLARRLKEVGVEMSAEGIEASVESGHFSAGLLVALLEALQIREITIEGDRVPVEPRLGNRYTNEVDRPHQLLPQLQAFLESQPESAISQRYRRFPAREARRTP